MQLSTVQDLIALHADKIQEKLSETTSSFFCPFAFWSRPIITGVACRFKWERVTSESINNGQITKNLSMSHNRSRSCCLRSGTLEREGEFEMRRAPTGLKSEIVDGIFIELTLGSS